MAFGLRPLFLAMWASPEAAYMSSQHGSQLPPNNLKENKADATMSFMIWLPRVTYHFFQLSFVTQSTPHTIWEQTAQGHKYQEAGITVGHLWGWLPQFKSLFGGPSREEQLLVMHLTIRWSFCMGEGPPQPSTQLWKGCSWSCEREGDIHLARRIPESFQSVGWQMLQPDHPHFLAAQIY